MWALVNDIWHWRADATLRFACGSDRYSVGDVIEWRDNMPTSHPMPACIACVLSAIQRRGSSMRPPPNTPRRWWILVRVVGAERIAFRYEALRPVWWSVEDHDGTDHATGGSQWTISLGSPVEAKDRNEAYSKRIREAVRDVLALGSIERFTSTCVLCDAPYHEKAADVPIFAPRIPGARVVPMCRACRTVKP